MYYNPFERITKSNYNNFVGWLPKGNADNLHERMIHMSKKWIAMLLVLAMLAALCVGCGSTDSKTEGSGQSTEAASAAESGEPAQSAEAEPAPVEEKTEKPAEEAAAPSESAPEEQPTPVEEAVTERSGDGVLLAEDASLEEILPNLSRLDRDIYPFSDGETVTFATSFGTDMYADLPNGYSDCLVNQLMAAITGVDLQFKETSNEAWTEQFNLMVASGDYPDLCSTRQKYSGGDDTGINDDFILPLEDYLDDYMPNYKSALNDYPEENYMKRVLTEEGHIPGLCAMSLSIGAAATNLGLFWIRTDYMEAAGLSTEEDALPQTYDEWYEVLTAFKNIGIEEPLMLPSTIINSNEGMISGFGIAGNYSVTQMSSYKPFYVVDGEVRFGILQPEFKEFLQMMAKWYSEGLISDEFYTKNASIKDAAFIATIVNGDAGIFFEDQMDVETVAAQAKEADPNFEMHALRDPMMERGQTNHFGSSTGGAISASTWVTTNATAEGEEHLAAVLGFADFLYTETGSDLAVWGPEGVTFLYDEEGNHVLTEYGDRIMVKNENLTMKFNFSMGTMGYFSRQSIDTNTEVLKAAIAYRTDYDIDSDYTLPTGVSLTSDESYEFNGMYNDISTYLDENILKFLTGAKSFDEYDAFIDDLYGFGIEDCIALYQTAYERYLAK